MPVVKSGNRLDIRTCKNGVYMNDDFRVDFQWQKRQAQMIVQGVCQDGDLPTGSLKGKRKKSEKGSCVIMTISEHLEASRKVELARKERLYRESMRKISAEIESGKFFKDLSCDLPDSVISKLKAKPSHD